MMGREFALYAYPRSLPCVFIRTGVSGAAGWARALESAEIVRPTACRWAGFETLRGHISVSSPFEEVADEPVSRLKRRFGRGGDALKKPSLTLTYSHLLSSTLISDGGILHYFRGKVGRAQKPYSRLPFRGALRSPSGRASTKCPRRRLSDGRVIPWSARVITKG
jgi:hypothetical protein